MVVQDGGYPVRVTHRPAALPPHHPLYRTTVPSTPHRASHLANRYYRFSGNSSSVYACPKPVLCLGGNRTGADTCQAGSEGPLCSLCLENYYYLDDGSDTNCVKCAWEASAVITTFSIGGAMLLIGIIAGLCSDRLTRIYEENENFILNLGEKMTAIFVTMQAIVLLKDNHASVGGTEFAVPYKHFLKYFQWMAFDFIDVLPVECAFGAKALNFFSKLIVTTLVPILFYLLVIAIGCLFPDHKYNNNIRNLENNRKTHMVQNLNYIGVQALYLTLPLICTTVCQTFRCDSFCYDNPEDEVRCIRCIHVYVVSVELQSAARTPSRPPTPNQIVATFQSTPAHCCRRRPPSPPLHRTTVARRSAPWKTRSGSSPPTTRSSATTTAATGTATPRCRSSYTRRSWSSSSRSASRSRST